MYDKYTNALAATVVKMFSEEKLDPSAEEIAEAHFPDHILPPPQGGEITDGIRKRLVKIHHIVEREYEIPCCLVTETYYTVFRSKPVDEITIREAYRCIPGGYHNSRYGLRRQAGDNDVIWRAAVERNLISAAGKEKRSVDRVLAAVATEDLSNENALALIRQLRERSEPEKPEIIQRLFKELEDEEDGVPRELEEGDED